MRYSTLGLLALAVAAGSAQATFFSFASDKDDKSWTWTGKGGGMFDAADATDPLVLVIDDNNGPLPSVEIGVEFEAEVTLSYIGSLAIGGGNFQHSYYAGGFFKFDDFSAGNPIINVSFTQAIVTSVGKADSWGSAGAFFASDTFTTVKYQAFIDMPAYGIFKGQTSTGPDDFGFDLSALNHTGVLPYIPTPASAGVSLGTDMLPNQQWWSESSFSGTATFIPAPASTALFGLAGILAARRRR